MSVHLFIQYTYNEITIIKFSEFRNELSIYHHSIKRKGRAFMSYIGPEVMTLGCSVIRL